MYEKEKTSINEFMSHPGTYCVAFAFMLAVGWAIGLLDEGIFKYLASILSSILNFAMAWFFFNSLRRGSPDINDLLGIFTTPGIFVKALPIVLVEFLITTVLNLISSLLAEIPVVGLAISLIVAAIGILLMPVRYMFAANHNYDTATYFKQAVKFMEGNVMRYLGLVMIFVLVVFGAVLVLSFMGFIGILLAIPAIMVVLMIFEIEIAMFALSIIPADWYGYNM